MGGGTSGLFFGTKGSRSEYQYSLFPDSVRKDARTCDEGISSVNVQIGSGVKTQSEKQLITAEMVLQKCSEYHIGRISAWQLVQWLTLVVSSSKYKMERQLRMLIRNAIGGRSDSLQLTVDRVSVFNQKLEEFESRLRQLH